MSELAGESFNGESFNTAPRGAPTERQRGRAGGEKLGWLLTEFARATAGVRSALVVSADGLRLATSPDLDDDLADQLSAAACGLVSLARGTAALLGTGPVSQTILEMERGYLFVTAINQGATLAVHADRTCDIGMVGYEMTMLASRAGHALTPQPRVAPS